MNSSYTDLPRNWPTATDWTSHVGHFFCSEEGRELIRFVTQKRKGTTVYPAFDDVFNAFALTSFSKTKVVILGQDPYHGAGQAHGLSFSVRDGIKLPPSLRNIFRELSDEFNLSLPVNGNLSTWARQGVLLLNTVLTVDEGKAGSHQGNGWEQFTDLVISKLNLHPQNLVFVLWGKPAQRKSGLIDSRHAIVASAHPSPLSAHRGFKGSRPFSKINAYLRSFGRNEIDWLTIGKSTPNFHEV